MILTITDDRDHFGAVGRRPRIGKLRPGALTEALSPDISGYRGVDSDQARVFGDPGPPKLVVAVTAIGGTHLR